MKQLATFTVIFLLLALPSRALTSEQASQIPREITSESVLFWMNHYRTLNDLDSLRADPRLTAAAADRMSEMEQEGYWSHDSPEGKSPFAVIRPRGYEFTFAGENLARGFETARLLVSAWMESPGHRQNILSPDYADAGIAIIDGNTTGRAYGRSVVVLFGRESAGAGLKQPAFPDRPPASNH